MTSVNSASSVSNGTNFTGLPSANTSRISDQNANLVSAATGRNPVEAGNALRQLDGITGNRATTNNAIQDGTRIAGRGIDCSDIPANLPAATQSVGGSAHLGIGITGSIGRFTATDGSNIYSGFFATGGGGVGLGAGFSGNAGVSNTSGIAGTSFEANVNAPLVSVGTSVGLNDGNLVVNGGTIGSGARLGGSANVTQTATFGCSVDRIPFQ